MLVWGPSECMWKLLSKVIHWSFCSTKIAALQTAIMSDVMFCHSGNHDKLCISWSISSSWKWLDRSWGLC